MCQFEYSHYQKCGHKSIEISEYCNEVFWKAGMMGYLTPCPEQYFRAFFVRIGTLDGLDFSSCRWMGLAGYCKMCEGKHGMPRSLPTHTYHDYEFLEGIGDLTSPILAIKLAEPLAYPAPSVSMQYSSTPNEGVTNEMIEYEFGRNPGTPHEATPAVGENLLARRLRASLHHPYIFTPYIKNTVAALISVEDQDIESLTSSEDQNTPDGLLEVFFPEKLQWYELDQGADGTTQQWRSRGYRGGQLIEGVSSNYFWQHAGLTPADEQYVVSKLRENIPLQVIWREAFKERGLDLTMFYQHGRKIEHHVIEERLKKPGPKPKAINSLRPFNANTGSALQPGGGHLPSGQSLHDINQQHLQQQQMQQIQMMQQRLAYRQRMREQQILQQNMLLQQQIQQAQILHEGARQHMQEEQMRQRMMRLQQFTYDKAPVVTVEEVEADIF